MFETVRKRIEHSLKTVHKRFVHGLNMLKTGLQDYENAFGMIQNNDSISQIGKYETVLGVQLATFELS